MMMVAACLSCLAWGCGAPPTYTIERRLPARVSLPEVHSLAVIAFVGTGGAALGASLSALLAADGAFAVRDASSLGAPPQPDASPEPRDSWLAERARALGLDAVIAGRVELLDVSGTLETATLVTKSTLEGPRDTPTVRKLKTGRLQASLRAVLADGRVVRDRSVEKDIRAERIEDPLPQFITLEPKNPPQDPIPTDDQLVARLVDAAAADMAHDLLPKREPARVTWEPAAGRDAAARKRFGEREYARAADELRALLGEKPPADPDARHLDGADMSASIRASLLYDLALCLDALGDLAGADRHLDEALTLENTELHQAALRDLRRREDAARREGQR